ncbi:dienelactone hydrolase family protein [Saccharothrix variisporea]|uniref:Dienelactone hydrolase n=1 Tax=Saccharothrix variisporea TaxID=543527 RepID=A0A495X2X4_9PSEU|nr:alpha/beta family hydrolase [Saccharothrix variisporea]RKT68561.1 dienelactone hydrolase [Saccharothrix variisporea]
MNSHLVEDPVAVRVGDLAGDLGVPPDPVGVVVFAHGSGSSRHSGRNRAVAAFLRDQGLATLLVDLLTADEERVDVRTGRLRFDIGLLAGRVADAVRWCGTCGETAGLPIGLFGASTGAAAALVAAAEVPVGAVVSRGGRPDLARAALSRVLVPTLLIVGSRDHQVLDLNRAAAARLGGRWAIEVVQGATHLFEEPGALDRVARLAAGWFRTHLAPYGTRTRIAE